MRVNSQTSVRNRMSSRVTPRLETHDLIGLDYVVDTWLSQIAGLQCYNVIPTSEVMDFAGMPTNTGSFYTAKVDVGEVERVDELLCRGFRVVDTALTFQSDVHRRPITPHHRSTEFIIDSVTPEDVDAVVEIAASTFRFSRFHLDPHFSDFVADRIKGEWARNLARGERGAGCLVARKAGRVVAFLGYLHADAQAPAIVIDLIAVDGAEQGQGVGTAIVEVLQAKAGLHGRAVLVGTQAANRGSVRLYENLGFRLHSAAYVLHRHMRASETA